MMNTRSHPSLPQAPRDGSAEADDWPALQADRQPLDSQALLQGGRWVEIRHNGELYRLQSTRLGKLILTK